MKRVLLDTNVVLDFALKREPYYKNAEAILVAIANGNACGYITAAMATDIFYLLQKTNGKSFALSMLADLITILDVLSVYSEDVRYALSLGWDDFEDALQAQVAVRNGMNAIITRNRKDYAKLQAVAVVLPSDFSKIL